MRRIRIFALGIVSFFAVLMGALLAPGTFVNRVLSAALCTVFSFSSTVCTVNLAKSSDRVVAATPPAVERNISDWLVQRDPGEFDDAPSVPAGSNPQAPPFPQDPGPNQPLRPDFDNPGSGQPNPLQSDKESLAGIWLYSIYGSSSESELAYVAPVEITESNGQFTISTCETNCGQLQTSTKFPTENFLTETYEDIIITWVGSQDRQTRWAIILDQKNGDEIYVLMEKMNSSLSLYNSKNLKNRQNYNSPIVVSMTKKESFLPLLTENPFRPEYNNREYFESEKKLREFIKNSKKDSFGRRDIAPEPVNSQPPATNQAPTTNRPSTNQPPTTNRPPIPRTPGYEGQGLTNEQLNRQPPSTNQPPTTNRPPIPRTPGYEGQGLTNEQISRSQPVRQWGGTANLSKYKEKLARIADKLGKVGGAIGKVAGIIGNAYTIDISKI